MVVDRVQSTTLMSHIGNELGARSEGRIQMCEVKLLVSEYMIVFSGMFDSKFVLEIYAPQIYVPRMCVPKIYVLEVCVPHVKCIPILEIYVPEIYATSN